MTKQSQALNDEIASPYASNAFTIALSAQREGSQCGGLIFYAIISGKRNPYE